MTSRSKQRVRGVGGGAASDEQGDLDVRVRDDQGVVRTLTLEGAYRIPNSMADIASVSELTSRGYSVDLAPGGGVLLAPDG
ncbi:MAG: hypothetical protein AAGN64_18460, partial [Bacteroidota bacterium]